MSTQSYHAGQEQSVRDRVVSAVYSTTEYNRFKFDPLNRPIDLDKAQRLYEAIERKNMLADNPILVQPDMTILDGQHRTKAAEALGVPVFYIFSGVATIDDVPGLNSERSSWTMRDHLRHWCAVGNENYLLLRDFVDKYSFLPLSAAIGLCYYGDNDGLRNKFTNGRYECNDLDFATRAVGVLMDFRAIGCKHWKQNTFISAVSNLLSNELYDHKRMMQKLNAKPQLILTPATTIEDYFDIFSAAYNWKTRPDNIVILKRVNSRNPGYREDKKRRQPI